MCRAAPLSLHPLHLSFPSCPFILLHHPLVRSSFHLPCRHFLLTPLSFLQSSPSPTCIHINFFIILISITYYDLYGTKQTKSNRCQSSAMVGIADVRYGTSSCSGESKQTQARVIPPLVSMVNHTFLSNGTSVVQVCGLFRQRHYV